MNTAQDMYSEGDLNKAVNKNVRYNLVLSSDVYDEVKALAKIRGVPTVELFRQFIKLGLILMQPNTKVTISDTDGERELLLL